MAGEHMEQSGLKRYTGVLATSERSACPIRMAEPNTAPVLPGIPAVRLTFTFLRYKKKRPEALQ